MRATLTSKGQVTLPKTLRDQLHLKAGDQLDFQLGADGNTLVVRPANRRAADLIGMAARAGRGPLDLDAIDAAIGQEVVAKQARSRP